MKLKEEVSGLHIPDFAVIGNPNFKAMTKLIDAMRGARTIEQYAHDCYITQGTLYKIISGNRVWNVDAHILESLYIHRDPDCHVTRSQLYSANGEAYISNSKKMRRSMKQDSQKTDRLPSIQHGKAGRPTMEKDDKIINFQQESTDSKLSYKKFKDYLAVYAMDLSKEEYGELYARKKELFDDKCFVEILEQYADAHENAKKNNQAMWEEALKTGIEPGKIDRSAQYAKQVLDKTLGFKSRPFTK